MKLKRLNLNRVTNIKIDKNDDVFVLTLTISNKSYPVLMMTSWDGRQVSFQDYDDVYLPSIALCEEMAKVTLSFILTSCNIFESNLIRDTPSDFNFQSFIYDILKDYGLKAALNVAMLSANLKGVNLPLTFTDFLISINKVLNSRGPRQFIGDLFYGAKNRIFGINNGA